MRSERVSICGLCGETLRPFRKPVFSDALRPGGPRHRNAAAPGAIPLRSISASGVTAPAKAAYAVTGIFYSFLPEF